MRVRAGWFFCQIGLLWLLCEWISVMSYMPLKVQTHCPSSSIFVAKLIEPIAEMTASVRLMEVSSTWLRPTAPILLSWDVLSNGEKSSSPDSQLITAKQATLQLKVRGASLQSYISPGFSAVLGMAVMDMTVCTSWYYYQAKQHSEPKFKHRQVHTGQ